MDGQQRRAGGAQEERRVFRSPLALGFGVVWLLFATANLVDLAVRGSGRDSLALAAVLLLATALVYVTCLRPRIVASESGVTVHNLLRDVRVPWAAVERVDATDTVRVHAAGRRYRCWAVQASHRTRTRARLREQARAAKVGAPAGATRGNEASSGRSRADGIAAELDAMADRFRDRARSDPTDAAGGSEEPAFSGSVTVTWSPYALAAPGVTAVLLAAALLIPV